MSLSRPNGVQATGRKGRGDKHVAGKGEPPWREGCKGCWCLSRTVPDSGHSTSKAPMGGGTVHPEWYLKTTLEEGAGEMGRISGLSPETRGGRGGAGTDV